MCSKLPNSTLFVRLFLGWISCIGCLAIPTSPLHGEEQCHEFLQKLREAGYYDTALDYLDEMEGSDLAPHTFRQLIPFERASILSESSRLIRDTNIRRAKLDQAQQSFEAFIEKFPNHDLVSVAKNRLANLLVQRAEVALLRSNVRGVTDKDKQALLLEARGFYQKSFDIYKKTRVELNEKLKRIAPDVTDSERIRVRDQYRTEFLQTLLLMPGVKEEMARTFEPGSAKQKEVLQEAVEEYKTVSERYRDWDAALYAQLYQARCLIKLEQFQPAYDLLVEIFEQVNTPNFRQFKKQALLLAVECWNNDSENPTVPFQAIEQLEPVLATVSENDRDPDWVLLRLELAQAYHRASKVIEEREEKTADDRRLINTYDNLAADLLRTVTKLGGPNKRKAQELLVEYGIRATAANATRPEPTNFSEAKARAREFLDSYENARFALTKLQTQIDDTEDVNERVKLIDQQKKAADTITQAPEKAKNYLNLALQFGEQSELPPAPDDVTSVYYFLAYTLYIQEEHEQVGVLANELMRVAPQGAGSRETAELGLNSYWTLYNSVDPSSRDFEYEMLTKTANGIIRQWEGRAEAVKAASLMCWVALQQDNLAAAENYLEMIPADSPQRFESELLVGQELWKQYVAATRQIREIEKDPSKGEVSDRQKAGVAAAKQKATQYLEAGAAKLTAKNISQTTAIASLSLAQSYVDSDEIGKAISHLEKDRSGLLTLLEANHPAVQNKWLTVTTYKTAVRAYIGDLRTSSEKQIRIKQSLDTMAKLEASMSDDPASRRQLISIYVSLADELRAQMDQLPTATEKQTFAQGLLAFLDQVRNDATELNTLVWVAQTLSKVGESFEESGLKAEANDLFDSAGATYEKILQQAKTDPSWLPEESKVEVQRQVARNYRNRGEYEKAIESYAEVLSAKSFIDVQIEAADTYQRWATETGAADRFANAIAGGAKQVDPKTKQEKNVIWGWGKLAQVMGRYPKYRDQFFEARFRLAECRFEFGKLKDSERVIKQSKNDIFQTFRIYPELGSNEMRQRTDKLLRSVQEELGDSSPQGLREFRRPKDLP